MDSETIYHALINRGISEKQLEREIARKSAEYSGYLSKEGILFLIAKEHGIPIIDKETGQQEEKEEEEERNGERMEPSEADREELSKKDQAIDSDEFVVPLKDIQEGMGNLTVLGRIEKVYEIREFTRKDTSSGRVGAFLLNDGTRTLKVNLWDAHTTLMEQEYFKEGELIRLMGCYATKNPKTEDLELHSSKKTILHLAPNGIEFYRFPHLKALLAESLPIHKYAKTNIGPMKGVIDKIVYFKEKENANGERSFILRFEIRDKTASYAVNVFGMQAVEVLRQIAEGKSISLDKTVFKYNPYTRQNEFYFAQNSTFFIS